LDDPIPEGWYEIWRAAHNGDQHVPVSYLDNRVAQQRLRNQGGVAEVCLGSGFIDFYGLDWREAPDVKP
jgi:hypothetical protein